MGEKTERELSDVERIYEDVKRRVRRKYDRRADLTGHAAAWMVAAGVYGYVVTTGALGGLPQNWVFLCATAFMVMWTLAFIIHASQLVFEGAKDRAIEREFRREMALRGYADKLKNDDYFNDHTPAERLVGLSEDGEIVDIEELHQRRRK